jgi:hypothetical protein
MRRTRRNHRKTLTVLALSLATSAVVAGPASGMVHDGGSIVTPTFAPITNVAQQYGGTAELPAAQQGEISYLSWGTVLKSEEQGGVTPTNLARAYVPQGGVTPTNLARAWGPKVQGVSSPDGYQPQLRGDEQLVIRDKPDGFQPQTKHAEVVSISADSGSFDSGDAALGFGLGLILATAAAIALAMSRDRERMAHS